MTCPKCGSGSIFSALDEAPHGVTNWVKCHICGKRFDPTTVAKVVDDVATIKQAFDDWEAERAGDCDEEEAIEQSMSEELDVFDDRDDPDRQDSLSDLAMKDQRVRRGGSKEPTMSRGWTPERRAKFMATMQAKRGGGRGRPKKAQATMENVPAIITPKPARAVKVSKAPMVVNGHTLTVLDHAIERVQHDLATLERAKEIVASYA